MSSPRNSWLKHIDFIILDLLIVILSYWGAVIWRFGGTEIEQRSFYRIVLAVLVLFAFIIDIIFPLHKDILKRGILRELRECLIYTIVLVGALIASLFFLHVSDSMSRLMVGIFGILLLILTYAAHLIYKKIVLKHLKKQDRKIHMLIICDRSKVSEYVAEVEKRRNDGYQIEGIIVPREQNGSTKIDFFHDDENRGDIAPLCCSFQELFSYIQTHVTDEVFIDIDQQAVEKRVASELLNMGLTVHISVYNMFGILPNQRIEMMNDHTVITSGIKPFSRGQMLGKRLMDIVGGLVGLAVTGILFLVFAPQIKHQSPGPVFYSQIRVGRNGRRFRIYKFRSMYPDADERKAELMKQNKMDGFMFKMDNDPRIFPIGRFMRKYSIDEFPQFLNVFKGDMSLVGTRPPTEDEWEKYKPWHRTRLSMKPGLTGLWQVSGRSNITDFEQVVSLDVQYISNWSLKEDIKILLRTVKVVLTGEGSE